MRRVLLGLTSVALLATASLVASAALPGSTTSSGRGPAVDPPSANEAAGFFERRVAEQPADAVSWTVLAELHHQRGRETGSEEPFAASERAARTAVELAPGYTRAQVALAATLISRHEFAEAERIASALLAAEPERGNVRAIRGDALLAMGRYEEAVRDYRLLDELDPGIESLARLAHLHELNGDPTGAIELIEQATVALRGTSGERAAWFHYRLGDLHRHLGRWAQARAAFDASRERLPEFPLALEGLVDVALKTGELDEAEARLERLSAVAPGPTTSLLHADLAALRGDDGSAARLVGRAIAELEQGEPALIGRDLAEVLADNDLRAQDAVALAEAELDRRPDVFSYDVVAWSRYRAGDLTGARTAIDSALELGTQEPGFLYHSALIAHAEGDAARARSDLTRALRINPRFDPFDAPAARSLLSELGPA